MSEMNENNVVEKGVGTVAGVGDITKLMSELSADSKRPFSRTEAVAALKLLESAIIESLKKGQKVQLTSFISIMPTYRTARKANNVLTGVPLDIPEGVTFTIKSGSALKAVSKGFSTETIQDIKAIAMSKRIQANKAE